MSRRNNTGLHFLKFYPEDWLSDPALRTCGPAARGAWIDLMCAMSKAEPYGHLVINERPATPRQIAGILGVTVDVANELIQELEEAGVFSRRGTMMQGHASQSVIEELEADKTTPPVPDGTIFSRRMVRDLLQYRTDVKNGSKGGNPNLKRGDTPPDRGGWRSPSDPAVNQGVVDDSNPWVNPPDKDQEARSQKPEARQPTSSVRAQARDTTTAVGSRLPEGWLPKADDIVFAEGLGLVVDDVVASFTDYWREQPGAKGRKVQWDGTFRNWCRKEAERRPPAGKLGLPLLRGIDGGKAAADDPWGIDAWCRANGAVPITDPEQLKRGKWKHSGAIIDSVARQVAEAAEFPRTLVIDWGLLPEWIAQGCNPNEHIYPAVKRAAEWYRGRGDPATHLAAFTQSIMKRKAA